MKLKLVLVGEAWTKHPFYKAASAYFMGENRKFLDKIGGICAKNIPDFKDWGPGEAYYQLPDFALPLKKKDKDKLGVTLCFSQLYQKEGRDIEGLTRETLGLVVDTLEKLGVYGVQVFPETHISDESGRSFFIELPAVLT